MNQNNILTACHGVASLMDIILFSDDIHNEKTSTVFYISQIQGGNYSMKFNLLEKSCTHTWWVWLLPVEHIHVDDDIMAHSLKIRIVEWDLWCPIMGYNGYWFLWFCMFVFVGLLELRVKRWELICHNFIHINCCKIWRLRNASEKYCLDVI